MARSERAAGRAFGDDRDDEAPVPMEASSRSRAPSHRSPPVLAPDEIEIDESSPDTDLCSSSAPDGGEIGSMTRDSNDVDRSSGESVRERERESERKGERDHVRSRFR